MRWLIGRVSPAMVVACAALVIALSGSSIAATVTHAVNGTQVKKNTLPGNRVKKGTLPGDRILPNSLGGKQINESRLARVPSAASADTAVLATTAGNATSLGSKPASAYRTFAAQAIPSGTTVTGAFGLSANFAGVTAAEIKQTVGLPGVAANDLTDEVVNFAPANAVSDGDASCTGSATAPTAPAGRVCLYLAASVGVDTRVTGEAIPLLPGSRAGFVVHAVQPNAATGVFGTWAYTAP